MARDAKADIVESEADRCELIKSEYGEAKNSAVSLFFLLPLGFLCLAT